MNPMLQIVADRMVTGLKRSSIKTVTSWAQQYRIMGSPFPGPWNYIHHPWIKHVQDSTADQKVGMKAAQMGYTEWALNTAFKGIDIDGISVLYVLPAKTPDASDFSTSRFDPALEASPHLAKLFTDVKNIGHKRAGSASLFVRGSRSRAQLKSVPAGIVILDEVDEMVQENIPMIFERMSGQLLKQSLLISTPTIEGHGISVYFKNSTQEHYFFKCPSCGRKTELVYPECLIITADDPTDNRIKDSHIICKECKNILNHSAKRDWLSVENSEWVPSYTDKWSEGFHINQLYSMTTTPWEIAQLALKADTSPADKQEFYNSKMGTTCTVEGAQVTEDEIQKATGSYTKAETGKGRSIVTMGVDVGTWLHCEISDYTFSPTVARTTDINIRAKCTVLNMLKVKHFEELDFLLIKYGVTGCVIDANPERRKSLEFARRFPGLVYACFYGNNLQGTKNINKNEAEKTITVDRTSWLDLSLGRFHNHTIRIPIDTTHEYKKQLRALVRIYEKDANGNPIGRYVNVEADHYGHARNYNEIALQIAASRGFNKNISGVV
jgi:hypothetical protein